MAHSFIMSFATEEEAFQAFSAVFPRSTLLVDTYDPINAVKVAIQKGINFSGVRIDGLNSVRITASGDLNEYIISDLVSKKAPIDYFGVGTELSTSRDDPALNGVYKLVAIKIRSNELGGNKYQTIYKRKKSPGKQDYPGPKQVHRLIRNNKLVTDILTLDDENINGSNPMLKQYVKEGAFIEKLPSVLEIRNWSRLQVNMLPERHKILNSVPDSFPVIVSDKLMTAVRDSF
jgi:nicotinate phosphoribosyltransferase